MNPVKPRNFIRESYFNFNVKDFAIDSLLELKKIEQETNYAKDIKIHLRIKLNSIGLCQSDSLCLNLVSSNVKLGSAT